MAPRHEAETVNTNRIQNQSVVKAALVFMGFRITALPALRLIGTVNSKFFFPQFQSLLKLKKRRIVNVDHELDSLIPFSPEYLPTYIGFTHLWVKSVFFIYREFGKRSLPYIRDFLIDLRQLYSSAFLVYDQCQSTTSRPPAGKNIGLKIMQAVDPHFHCVPSLHVMVVCFTHMKIRNILSELAEPEHKYEAETEYLETKAVSITDSILYMKQHSINCISAGLFALKDLYPEMTDDYADKIADGIERLNKDRINGIEKISSYIINLYYQFREQSAGKSAAEVLVDFLLNYS